MVVSGATGNSLFRSLAIPTLSSARDLFMPEEQQIPRALRFGMTILVWLVFPPDKATTAAALISSVL